MNAATSATPTSWRSRRISANWGQNFLDTANSLAYNQSKEDRITSYNVCYTKLLREVAAKTPEKILKVTIDPVTGLQPFHARKLAFGLKLEGQQVGAAVKFLRAMYDAFVVV